MKARHLIVGAFVLCASALLLTTCRAAETADKAASTSKAAVVSPASVNQPVQTQTADTSVAKQSKATVLTGSYIPANIKKSGRITDGDLNVKVIDRKEIEGSGATSVAQILALEPGVRIIRH